MRAKDEFATTELPYASIRETAQGQPSRPEQTAVQVPASLAPPFIFRNENLGNELVFGRNARIVDVILNAEIRAKLDAFLAYDLKNLDPSPGVTGCTVRWAQNADAFYRD
jgi:hypothetical protein